MDNISLPAGWRIIHPALDDLSRVTQFIRSCDEAYFGEPDTTEGDVDYEWRRPGFDFERDAYLVQTSDEKIAGYTDFYIHDNELYVTHNTAVHPDYLDRISVKDLFSAGVNKAQIELSSGGRVRTISLRDETNRMLEELDFHPIQIQYRMRIDFDQPPKEAIWPSGYQLTTFSQEKHAREVFDVIETAFQELPHRRGNTYEGWAEFILKRTDFDPSLLFMATKDGEIVGVAVGFDNPIGGWIRQLAVKKSHRGQGIAMAILKHAFVEFYRRGRSSVGLTVDSENLTGAPQLYLRAGMRQIEKYITYVREI